MFTKHYSELQTELTFKAIKSQGPGGQNVNKVNTCIELRFNIRSSRILSSYEKEKIEYFLRSRITSDGELIIISQESRSQLQNKEEAIRRFYTLIERAMLPVRKRKPTRPSRGSVKKRLEAKTHLGNKKRLRSKNDFSSDL